MDSKTIRKYAPLVALCLAALSFPFSVASSNAAFGLTLLLSLISGDMQRGASVLWTQYRGLLGAFGAMLGLMTLSLLWSPDVTEGVGKIGHLWFLLLLPSLTSMLADKRPRQAFLISLSIGLASHLGFCVVQAMDLFHIVINSAASSPDDPAGHIGHIGFGFVYGLWAGWLILHALNHHGWQRWLPLAVALWAIVMVFMVQGRGGYVTVFAILTAIIWKEFVHGTLARRLPWFIGGIMLLIITVAIGPGQERVLQTWQQLKTAAAGDLSNSEARLPLWEASFKAWQNRPFLGHGVGGFHAALSEVFKDTPELKTHTISSLAHPHNIYLLALVRDGILGLATLLFLLFIWFRTGWRMNWTTDATGYLIAAPALALMVNGMTSSSLEEHFSGIMAILFLTCGLASQKNKASFEGSPINPNPHQS